MAELFLCFVFCVCVDQNHLVFILWLSFTNRGGKSSNRLVSTISHLKVDLLLFACRLFWDVIFCVKKSPGRRTEAFLGRWHSWDLAHIGAAPALAAYHFSHFDFCLHTAWNAYSSLISGWITVPSKLKLRIVPAASLKYQSLHWIALVLEVLLPSFFCQILLIWKYMNKSVCFFLLYFCLWHCCSLNLQSSQIESATHLKYWAQPSGATRWRSSSFVQSI